MSDVPDYLKDGNQSLEQQAEAAPAPDADDAPWLQGGTIGEDMTDPERPAGNTALRYWMPKGSSKTIIFLSDGMGEFGPPTVYEHNPPAGQGPKRWQNWTSCLAPLGVECPLCKWAATHENQGGRYKGMFFTIIDCDKFTDRQGNERSMVKKLLCAKKDIAEMLARKYVKISSQVKAA